MAASPAIGTAPVELSSATARRRRAVELRLAGKTWAQVQEASGLSLPTVMDAFKAFQAGGWPAVTAPPRGRTAGKGRALSPADEAQLRSLPLDPTLPPGVVWSDPAVQPTMPYHSGVNA